MAIPLSNTPYQNAYAAEFEEIDEIISGLSELVDNEAEGNGLLQPATDLGGDSAVLNQLQGANFISEQMIPLLSPLAQQVLINNRQLPLQKTGLSDASDAPAEQSSAQAALEDKNITANYLFSLNPLRQVTTEMKNASNRHEPRRESQERNEMFQLLQPEAHAAPVSDEDLSPMIEAIVKETPQVSIELPGGVELRITLEASGKPTVMYVNPDGTLRTLGKGKTLRLNRWVNGIVVRTDGTIAMVP